ncbi:hypothetical protein HK098_002537 [Nowakowskiella sp. JEL0407]|nr:hypothetical protein HK098_002537 [Nowakowskiella sp. JEL0407]
MGNTGRLILSDSKTSSQWVIPTKDGASEFIVLPRSSKVDTLTVLDNRTGKTYQVDIDEGGVISATTFQKMKLIGGGPGLRIYDPAYLNTAVARSKICEIDGDKGILRYRGYPIEELAEKSTFVEVSFLLIYGYLPSKSQLEAWTTDVMRHTILHTKMQELMHSFQYDAHPMGMFISSIAALSTLSPEANPSLVGSDLFQKNILARNKQVIRLIGKTPTIAAACYRHRIGREYNEPQANLSYCENFLYMMDHLSEKNYVPNTVLTKALDILFILHADHELNCSTAAMRHIGSSLVDPYSCVAGAAAALYGPLHGGANEAVLRMLEEIGTVDKISQFIEDVKNKKRKLMGFGHRVYKTYDPRATIIRRVAYQVFEVVGRESLIDVAIELEKIALSDQYFIQRNLYPNVDYYSGLIYRAMGFPTDFFPVLFAIPRVSGWLAHWVESIQDPEQFPEHSSLENCTTTPGVRWGRKKELCSLGASTGQPRVSAYAQQTPVLEANQRGIVRGQEEQTLIRNVLSVTRNAHPIVRHCPLTFPLYTPSNVCEKVEWNDFVNLGDDLEDQSQNCVVEELLSSSPIIPFNLPNSALSDQLTPSTPEEINKSASEIDFPLAAHSTPSFPDYFNAKLELSFPDCADPAQLIISSDTKNRLDPNSLPPWPLPPVGADFFYYYTMCFAYQQQIAQQNGVFGQSSAPVPFPIPIFPPPIALDPILDEKKLAEPSKESPSKANTPESKKPALSTVNSNTSTPINKKISKARSDSSLVVSNNSKNTTAEVSTRPLRSIKMQPSTKRVLRSYVEKPESPKSSQRITRSSRLLREDSPSSDTDSGYMSTLTERKKRVIIDSDQESENDVSDDLDQDEEEEVAKKEMNKEVKKRKGNSNLAGASVCSRCGEEFPRLTDLASHSRIHHSRNRTDSDESRRRGRPRKSI